MSGDSTVFISHSSHDLVKAVQLGEAIEALGQRVWLASRDVQPGANYADEIVSYIATANAVIVLLSMDSARSEHVRREISLAIDNHRRLLPVALSDDLLDSRAIPNDWKYFLSVVQMIRWSTPAGVARVILPYLSPLPEHAAVSGAIEGLLA